MNTYVDFKNVCEDGFEIECQVTPIIEFTECNKDERSRRIAEEVASLDDRISVTNEQIEKLNAEINRLTNHADGVDYTIAVASGIISGLIDSFFVGELGLFENASEMAKDRFRGDKGHTHEGINRFIEKYAKMKGYKGKGGLRGAIAFLEEKYPVGQDNIWSGKNISSTKTHHLDDLAHHPTILGLFSSILVQFLRVSFFSNKDGEVNFVYVPPKKEDVIKIIVPIFLSGLIKWLVNLAEKNEIIKFDENIPKPIQELVKNLHKIPIAISVLKVVDNWFGHLVSDMGGSKSTAGGGTGISGLYLSFFKEISMLPGMKDSSLPKILNDLYQNKKTSPLTDKLDFRTELNVFKEQMLPVVINEVIVRTLFLVRHLVKEARKAEKFEDIAWENIIPFGNRTIVRMMTISTSTFMAVDIADAAIRTAVEHPEACSNPGTFFGAMILRVNFVGVGRVAVAVGTDVSMGIKRNIYRDARMKLYEQQISLVNAKMFYKEADMWISAENAGEAINKAYQMAEFSGKYYAEALTNISNDMKKIDEYIPEIQQKNPALIEDIKNAIRWG